MKKYEFQHQNENNFNLIRLIAATLVLLSHSYTVVTGDANMEPLREWLGVTFGSIAVDVFFVISGFLITASMKNSDSVILFISARFLRIFPALVVSLLITVALVSCIYIDTVSFKSAANYVWRNALLVVDMPAKIEGIFEANPAGPGFNASLWTLPVELRMYRNVLIIWFLSFIAFGRRRNLFDILIVCAAVYFAMNHFAVANQVSMEKSPYRLQYMFFFGSASFILFRYLRINFVLFLVASLVLVFSFLFKTLFFVVYSAVLWYLVLCLAFLIKGRVLEFNRVGDYSYGVYVYAWPVQQLTIALLPSDIVAVNWIASLFVVILLSIFSWHLIEKPTLRLKGRISQFKEVIYKMVSLKINAHLNR